MQTQKPLSQIFAGPSRFSEPRCTGIPRLEKGTSNPQHSQGELHCDQPQLSTQRHSPLLQQQGNGRAVDKGGQVCLNLVSNI
jgi:hypothetical protein